MKKFEHDKVVAHAYDNEILKRMENQGWELVSVVHFSWTTGIVCSVDQYEYFFKREVE
jgi:hypothetical protein